MASPQRHDEVVHLAQEGVHRLVLLLAGVGELDQEQGGVDPEARDPEPGPEPHDPQDLLPDRRVGDVQVGLVREEAVEVVGLDLLVPGPGRLLHARKTMPWSASAGFSADQT